MKPTERYQFNSMVVDRYVLDNGLTILHHPERRSPIFAYQTWFRVGSRHDPEGQTGRAHFFEHLMFKGTRSMPEGELDRVIEARGGRINAATWLDWTCYEIDAPTDLFEDVVRYESDRMANLELNREKLESERQVVLNERRERVEDDVDGFLVEALWEKAFGRHPYGRPTIGYTTDIESLTLEQFQAFYSNRYAPDEAVVVVVGDLDSRRVIDAIEEAYGGIPRGGREPTVPSMFHHNKSAGAVEISRPLSGERLLMAYGIPNATSREAMTIEVLNELLVEGDSCRLMRALITDGELASSQYGFPSMLREGGLLELGVDLRAGRRAEEAEAIILRAIQDIADGAIEQAELERALNKLELTAYRELQTAQQRAQAIGYWEVTADDFRWAFDVDTRLRKITVDDIRSVAQTILAPERRTVVYGRVAT